MIFPFKIKDKHNRTSQPKSVIPKMRQHKLRSAVYWHSALKQQGVKKGVKQEMGV
jgi:hypothetical protein